MRLLASFIIYPMKLPSILVLLLILWHQSHAQTTISGHVKDGANEEALIGAIVSTGVDTTVTDTNGNFHLSVRAFPITLLVNYLGYQTLTIQMRAPKEITLALEPSSLTLNDVIVTSGSFSRKTLNTPTSIQSINQEMLRRDDPFSVTSALNRTPGVYMHAGTLTTNRITIRGIGSRSLYGTNKIKAYYEDIPLTDGSGNSSIEDIDQEMISRIEITKGPNSSAYGAGLGGAIRILAPVPSAQQTSAKTSLTMGSFDTYRWMLQGAHHDNKTTVSAVYSDLQRQGFRENSAYSRQQAGVTLKYQLTPQSYFSVLGIFTHLRAFIPSSISEDDFKNSPEKAAFTWKQAKGYEAYDKTLLGLSYHQAFGQDWSLKSTLFLKNRDAYEPRPFNILDEETFTIGTRNTLSKRWENFRLFTGMELFFDEYRWKTFENNYDENSNGSVKGDPLSNNLENRSYFNAFIEAAATLAPNLNATAGLNLNFTHYTLDDQFNEPGNNISGDYAFDPVVSPKLGLTYVAGAHNTLFMNVSHGFSPPSLEETLYPDGQINPDILPESGWNYELGVRGTQRRFTYDLTTYYMQIKNLLVAQRISDDAYVGVNAGLNNHLGVDLLGNYYFVLSDRYTLNTFASVAYMNYHFDEFVNDGNDYSGNELTGVPQWIFNPGVELLSDLGFYGNISGQLVGEIPVNDENSLYAERYFILRAKAGFRHVIGPWELDMNLGANNLTDTKYAAMLLINATGFGGSQPRYYYPGNPRNYFGGVSLKYTFR